MKIGDETSDLGIANVINNFFADIGPGLAEQIPESLLTCDYNFNGNYDTFNVEPESVEEVINLLNNISVTKSTGDDGVPIRFFQNEYHLIW